MAIIRTKKAIETRQINLSISHESGRKTPQVREYHGPVKLPPAVDEDQHRQHYSPKHTERRTLTLSDYLRSSGIAETRSQKRSKTDNGKTSNDASQPEKSPLAAELEQLLIKKEAANDLNNSSPTSSLFTISHVKSKDSLKEETNSSLVGYSKQSIPPEKQQSSLGDELKAMLDRDNGCY